jgi:polysaccharide export outer membrane protein
MVLVEVLEALPGRPISGERLVRPDGRISLGFYGEIPVAGLTIPEIKERIVLRLRKFLEDDRLGLFELDKKTGEYKRHPNGQPILKDPKETDRVFVDVTAYNSQNYYILGEVAMPGRLPYTGGDTVLDLVQFAGGLLPTADRSKIRLIRSYPKGSPARVLPIDYDEIAMGTDSSTNYPILPNDRLVIPRVGSSRADRESDRGASRDEDPFQDVLGTMRPAPRADRGAQRSGYFNRRAFLPAQNPNAELAKRIDELEKKLDRLIEVVEKGQPKAAGEPSEMPGPSPVMRNPFDVDAEPPVAGRAISPPGRPAEEGARSPGPQPPRPRRVQPMGPGRLIPRRPRRNEPRRTPERPSTRPQMQESVKPPSDGPPGSPRLPEGDESPFNDLPPECSPG